MDFMISNNEIPEAGTAKCIGIDVAAILHRRGTMKSTFFD